MTSYWKKYTWTHHLNSGSIKIAACDISTFYCLKAFIAFDRFSQNCLSAQKMGTPWEKSETWMISLQEIQLLSFLCGLALCCRFFQFTCRCETATSSSVTVYTLWSLCWFRLHQNNLSHIGRMCQILRQCLWIMQSCNFIFLKNT